MIGSDTIPSRKTNQALSNAKKEKKSEFYTTYETIEKELVYYTEDFKDKNVVTAMMTSILIFISISPRTLINSSSNLLPVFPTA